MDQSDQQAASTVSAVKTHNGGCHCGAVRFAVALDLAAGGSRCNCTICARIAGTTSIVAPAAFRLVAGRDSLSSYGGEAGRRSFCKHCGIHCFGRGHLAQLGGDYVSVSLNCLDDFDASDVKVVHWDGRHDNWQAGPRSAPWPVRTEAERKAPPAQR